MVADEVRTLAALAAQNTNVLISRSIQALMDGIAASSVQQSEMVFLVENGIREISTVVQANSSAAEKSAAVSKELSREPRTLDSLMNRFRIPGAPAARTPSPFYPAPVQKTGRNRPITLCACGAIDIRRGFRYDEKGWFYAGNRHY